MKTVFAKTSEKIILSAKLSEDKLKLFIDVEPVQGESAPLITRDDIMTVLAEFAGSAEINVDVIDDVVKHLNKAEKVSERRISKGTAPIDGSDGKILLLLKKFNDQAVLRADQRSYADFTDIHLFDNVKKGQIVGRVYPPHAGTDGVDALGGKIPAKPGKPFKTSVDKTITIKKDENTSNNYEVLIAEEDGYLCEESGKVMIKAELAVSGDLDYRYGSVDFIGKVIVQGDVLPGFNITAGKGIEVRGSVRGGSLICMGGDIVVRGYVYGGKESRVICAKSFSANVAQEINAEVGGDIIIHKEAIDCRLRSETSVYVNGGQLVGGETFVVCGVEAKFLGNQANKETLIIFCSDVETHTEYAKVAVAIESHEKAKSLVEMHLGPLAQNPARIQLLKSPHREKMQALHRKMEEIERSRLELIAKKTKLLENARNNQVIRANYQSTCYDGVLIRAGEQNFTVKETLNGPGSINFVSSEQKFEITAYQPLECDYNISVKEGDTDDKSKKPA